MHGRAGGTHSTGKVRSERATRNIRVQADSVARLWPLTSQIGASGTGHRVQKLVAEGLFSGAAVNESGAAVHRLLQLGCERSGIVTWITGQRAGVSDPE